MRALLSGDAAASRGVFGSIHSTAFRVCFLFLSFLKPLFAKPYVLWHFVRQCGV